MKELRTALAATLAVLAVGAFAQHPAPPKAKLTGLQASRIALNKYHGKIVGKVVLENEEGTWQYAVSIQSGRRLREVMIDANTGKIAHVEITTSAKEAKEAAAERKHPAWK